MIESLFLLVALASDSTAVASPYPVEGARPLTAAIETRAGIAPLPIEDSTRPRTRAVAVSDSYAWKFRAHQIGSYLIIPLFAAQYVMGSELLQQKEDLYVGRRKVAINPTLRTAHLVTAISVGTVFLANSGTGGMLLYENRNDPHNRALKFAHTATMLLADAGFVATGVMGRRALVQTPAYARRHQHVALASMSVATASAAMMWILGK